MSEKYSKTSAYECEICGGLHDSPSLAEKCYTKCRLYDLITEIAELRIRGGLIDSDEYEHTTLVIASMLEDLEEVRADLSDEYGDKCDHGEHMKYVQDEGGVYCSRCDEQVNEHPLNDND